MALVDNIMIYCEENGITVKEFERKCKLSNSLVSKWRSGVAKPSLATLYKIVSATGVDLNAWLVEGGAHDGSGQDQGTICRAAHQD